MEKERKLQIIRMAEKRFARHGINKTTLDEIARDLRIGKATIYHYFNSKDELFYAALAWECQQFLEEIKNIFSKEDTNAINKLTEYFMFKVTLNQKYNLLYDALLVILKENNFENEVEQIKNLFIDEEEILSAFIRKNFSEKKIFQHASSISLLIYQSWGLVFTGKINQVLQPVNEGSIKESLLSIIENL